MIGEERIRRAVNKMKRKKVAGIGEIPMEAWMSVGERETQKIIKGLNKHCGTVIQERNLKKGNANIREGYLCFGV